MSTAPVAVLTENLGTCSSKHRLLAAVAQESGNEEIRLMVGIYEMQEANTPGVGVVLSTYGIESIPEAHCYLMVDGVRFDQTGLPGGAVSPFDSLLEEHQTSPGCLAEFKVRAHRRVLDDWAGQRGIAARFAWQVREECIAALASKR